MACVSPNMVCLLCRKNGRLAKAHIMPRSMNRELRKVSGHHVNSPMETFQRSTGETKRYAMGPYDKTIICAKCDAYFSPWEQHAIDVLFRHHSWTGLTFD